MSKDKEQEQRQKCEMIILLYFGEYLPQWQKLMECRKRLISVKSDCVTASSDDDCQHFLQPFEDAINHFQDEEAIMRVAMLQKARKLMPHRYFRAAKEFIGLDRKRST